MATYQAKPFWLGKKFWHVMIAAMVILILALTKTVQFSPEQIMNFVLTLVGIGVGGHVLTDVSGIVSRTIEAKQSQPTVVQAERAKDTLPAILPTEVHWDLDNR